MTVVQEPSVSITLDGDEFRPVELEVKTNRYNKANMLKTKGLYDSEPKAEDTVTASINGNAVFYGEVYKDSDNENGLVGIKAYGPVKRLKRESVTKSYEKARVDQIVEDALSNVDIETNLRLPTQFHSANFKQINASQLLERITAWTDTVWWIDGRGVLNVQPIDSAITEHELTHVKKTSAGLASPPYRSVKVIGTLAESHEESHLISKNQLIAKAGSGDPVFTYENKHIRTKQQAKNTARAILKELKQQNKGGWVLNVGEGAKLNAFDVFSMPDALGGERYNVSALVHRMNTSDGFVTKIKCGGPIDESLSVTVSTESTPETTDANDLKSVGETVVNTREQVQEQQEDNIFEETLEAIGDFLEPSEDYDNPYQR